MQANQENMKDILYIGASDYFFQGISNYVLQINYLIFQSCRRDIDLCIDEILIFKGRRIDK